MTALTISFSVVALILSLSALVVAAKSNKDAAAAKRLAEIERHSVVRRLPGSEIKFGNTEKPKPTHSYSFAESDGVWTWEIERWCPPADSWSRYIYRFTHDHKPLATGTAKSRKAAERAVQRWFWQEFKKRHMPRPNGLIGEQTWTVKS